MCVSLCYYHHFKKTRTPKVTWKSPILLKSFSILQRSTSARCGVSDLDCRLYIYQLFSISAVLSLRYSLTFPQTKLHYSQTVLLSTTRLSCGRTSQKRCRLIALCNTHQVCICVCAHVCAFVGSRVCLFVTHGRLRTCQSNVFDGMLMLSQWMRSVVKLMINLMQPPAFGQRNFWHELRPTVWGETVDSAESPWLQKKCVMKIACGFGFTLELTFSWINKG